MVNNEFQFAVEAAMLRFPYDKVWGESINDGMGYGVFVERQGVKVAFQVKSVVQVDGKAFDNDIRNHGAAVNEALASGFDAMEQSLMRLIEKKPKGLFTRMKEAVLG